MKLYCVEVTYETVIYAENEKDALKQAPYIIKHEDDGDPADTFATEIDSVKTLPSGWDGDCFPYGKDAQYIKIKEILEQQNVES